MQAAMPQEKHVYQFVDGIRKSTTTKHGRQAGGPAARRVRPAVESLERRDLMSAGISYDAATGIVNIQGSSQNDVANVSIVNFQVMVTLTCYDSAPPNLSFLNVTKNYLLGSVKEVKFYGHDGHDKFTNNTSIKSYADGGLGNDKLTGGAGADYLIGNYGNDTIHGGAGNDSVWGSGGHDRLFGNDGNDLVKGHGGADAIWGGSGSDSLHGGAGNDSLFGETGNDEVVCIGGGTDTVTGGSHWDNVWMDTTDVMNDASSSELSLGYIHKVNKFYSYSFDGGLTSVPVSKELEGQDLADPYPHEGQLWSANFKNNPLFASGGPTQDDVFQGAVGDCYFLSRLAAMAKAKPDSIRKMVVDLGDGTHAVRFFRNGKAEYVRVDADLYTGDPAGTMLTYAKFGKDQSIWVAIVEKAYAFWRTKEGNYPSIHGGGGGLNGASSSQELLGGAVNPKIQISHPVTFADLDAWRDAGSPNGDVKDKIQEVLDWANGGQPSGQLKNSIMNAVKSWLNAVKDALASGKAVVIGCRYGVSDKRDLTLETFRAGGHVITADAVLTDANGNPIGIRLRDQIGQTNNNTGYSNGYVEMTDLVRIYCLLGSAAAMTV